MTNLDEILSNVKTVAISGHVRPDGDCVGSTLAIYNYTIAPFSVHPYQQFLAFALGSHDMHLPACGSQSVADHADVCHRGELDQYVAANPEDLLFESQHVGRTFFDKEDLLSAFSSSGRVHVYDVGAELSQYIFYGTAFGLCIADAYVPGFKHLEIVSCSFAQGLLHLVVQDFLRFLREEPAVDSESSCEICNLP